MLKPYHFHAVMQKTKNPEIIRSLLDTMKEQQIHRCAIAHTMLISAYCDRGQFDQALEVLHTMRVGLYF